MSQGEHKIRQILVALDSSPASLAALKQAVDLAADFEATVLGLYVEDINLLRVAEISFTHEVGLFSARSRRLEIQYVERQFKGQASKARDALAKLAKQAGVEWSFRVVRGVITTELLAAAAEADLIIMGRVGLSPLGRRRMGSTARAILLQAPQLTLILHPGGLQLGLPVVAIFDGSAVAQKALATAAQLLHSKTSRLSVLILADDPETAQKLQHQAEKTLNQQGLSAHYLWQSRSGVQGVIHKIRMEGCQFLVVPGEGAQLDHDTVLALLEQIECPVLLVK